MHKQNKVIANTYTLTAYSLTDAKGLQYQCLQMKFWNQMYYKGT